MTNQQERVLIETVRACLTAVRAASVEAEVRLRDRFEAAFPPEPPPDVPAPFGRGELLGPRPGGPG
jgi:hypothetical protein